METDLIARLTVEEHREQAWTSFMFNVDEALQLRNATKDEVLAVLAAGGKFGGTGWSTGKASRTLFGLSGVAVVKSSVQPYINAWLFAIALITQMDLPQFDLDKDVAEAAFAIAARVDKVAPTPVPAEPVALDSEDSDDEQVRFGWDEDATELPKELRALWDRAHSGDQRIDVRKLLEEHPRFEGIPNKAAENNLLPEFRKKQDAFLKAVSQQVLNVLRLLGYNWVRPVDSQVQLHLWQYIAELYGK